MNIVCPRCREAMQAPDDLAEATCLNCGQVLALAQTHVTASAPMAAAIRSSDAPEWVPGQSMPAPEVLPETYASWDEFRALSPALQTELLKLATCALPDMRGLEILPLPETLPPKVDEFAQPLATLTIPGEKRPLNFTIGMVVAVVGCLVLLVGGFELGTMRVQRGGMLAYPLLALGLVGLGIGFWFLLLRRPALEITVWFYENGLYLQRGGEVEACGWEDIREFRSDENSRRPAYMLVTHNDCRLILSAEQSAEIMPLAEYVKVRVASAQFLPMLRRIYDGGRARFGSIWVSRAGIGGAIGAHWSQVVRVMTDRANLFIDSKGRETWHQIPLRNISFVVALQAISHVMIEEYQRLPADEAK